MPRVERSPDRGCPSEDAVAAFVAGEDPDGDVALHLDECTRCRRIVSALAEVNYEELPRAAGDGIADTELASPSARTSSGGADGGRPPPAVIPGQRLGRFTVKRLLGQGGMGEVWAAHDSVLDREVAVKLLRVRAELLGAEAAERLKREAQAMARLRHPNVVAIHELGEAEGQLFCAMELVDGVTLRSWLEQPRRWRDTLDLLLATGRGIAAAHAAGLVHRDIKPDNVLVTRDGRPLVTDFGLAKLGDLDDLGPEAAAIARASLSTVRARAAPRPARSATSPARPLTTTGLIIGTPVYMPLEQLEGRDAGPASDQFSFCVTAYEALFGARPFAGTTIDDLVTAVARGASPPDRTNSVPRGVIKCLLRGLAPAPAQRFASMDALLDQLAREAGRRSRHLRVAIVGGAVALGATVAAFAWSGHSDPQESVRTAASTRMSLVWGDADRAQLAAHVRALGVPVAADRAEHIVQELDAYRVRWLAARVDAWAATRVRGEQTQEALERRIACLERMANAMHATVRVLATITAAELEKAPDVVTALPDVAVCANVAMLARESVLPSTPEGRALDAELNGLEALHLIGRNDEALAKATSAVTAIEQSSDQTQLPRAVFHLGWIQADLGRLTDAEAQLRRALDLGAAAQNHALVASVWLRLFSVIGLEQRRPDAALALEPAVRAAVLQAGDDPLHQAQLAKTQGLVESARGNSAGAYERFVRARELYVAVRGPAHYDVAVADINIASIELLLGKLAEAQQRLETVVAAFGATEAGRRHPTVGQAHQNLCAVAWRQQDFARSEKHCRAAADVYAASIGPDHRTTAKSRLYLGRALRKLGRLEEAQTEIERARTTYEKTLPPENVERIQADVYVAQVAAERGNFGEAETLARRALAAMRQHGLPLHQHAFTLSELARFVSHRDPVEALGFYDEALTIHVAQAARDKSGDIETLTELANVALAAKQPQRALAWFSKMPESAAQLPDLRKALEAKRVR